MLGFIIFTIGCFHWGARATHKLPKQTALHKKYQYNGDVIIVGAGPSGLAAARVLEENNIRYVVLEATDQYGGRLQEDSDFADFPVDLGAEWIHNNKEILDVLSGEEGASSSLELLPYHLEHAYTWDDGEYKKASKTLLDGQFDFFPEYKFTNSTWHSFVRTYFGERVVEHIRFSSPVSQIDYSEEKVKVTLAAGEVLVSDKVLVTASIGVLKSGDIQFLPPMSDTKKDAISSVKFLPGMKLLLKFSEQFYPDAISCSVEEGEKTYYDVAFKKNAEDHVLGMLVTGAASVPYTRVPSDEAVSNVLQELDSIFDGRASASYTGEYRLVDWGNHPYTKGTWVEGFRISKGTLKQLNRSLEKRVYFAGEANDVYQQLGVPGAILSGLYSIDRLLLGSE